MASFVALIDVLDRSKKRIGIAFCLAVLLHLPATPVVPVLRLVHRLSPSPTNQPPPPPMEVEVELREALRDEELRKQQLNRPPPESKGPSLDVSPPAPPPKAGGVKFSESTPAPEKDPETQKDPKKDKVKDVGLEGLSDPAKSKPGLTLGLWLSSVRETPLGKRLAELAACDREWKVFVDQGVDLLNDFDGVLVVGPGLFLAKDMTVAVRHSLPGERVHAVVDALVRQSGETGHWISPDVATARLGKVQRMLLPQQADLFFVTPTKGWEALHNVKAPLRVPTAEGRVASLVLAPPTKALERAGLQLPKRISTMRLEVFANPDQSLDIRVELEDESSEAALADLKRVNQQVHGFFADVWSVAGTIGALTGADDDNAPSETAPRLDLSVDDKSLSGMAHLSPSQTRTSLAIASSILCRKSKRRGRH